MDVKKENNIRKKQPALEKCLTELYNAMDKNDVNNIRKLIVKAIRIIMKKNIMFDKHIVDLLSSYMDYKRNKPKTAIKYLEERFLVLAKICESKLDNLHYLKKMAVFTTAESFGYLFMKTQNPELDDKQILRKIEDSSLQYEIKEKKPIEEKKPDTQLLDNLASADSVLTNSIMSDYSRSE